MNTPYQPYPYPAPEITPPDKFPDPTPTDNPQPQFMQLQIAPAASTMNIPAYAPPDSRSPELLVNPAYAPAFLRANIGKLVRAEMSIGRDAAERVGRLLEVGADYLVLQSFEPNTTVLCDLRSIRCVHIVEPGPYAPAE